MKRKGLYSLFISVLLLLAAALGCKQMELGSQWRNTEITVDGADTEWSGLLSYLEKEQLAFGIQNDKSNLYLCLKFNRRTQMQAVMQGFTVWFDSTGGDKKILGIRFPIGLRNFDDGEGNFEMPMTPGARPAGRIPDEMQKRLAEMLREIEIIGPDKDDRIRVPVLTAYGIQAAVSSFSSEHVYELKIPLQRGTGYPYAIAINPGKTIGIGFETGKFNREKLGGPRVRMGGGGTPGSLPPGGMPPRGMPGGMSESLKMWMRVTLAANEPGAR